MLYARGSSRQGKPPESFYTPIDNASIFRCGLVHEYYAKANCDIYMSKKLDKPIGIGMEVSGKFYFVVETYFEDLKHALDQLEKDLFSVIT